MIQNPKRVKWIIGGAIISFSILILSFLGLEENSVYFYTPKEAVEQATKLGQKEIRVGGMVKDGSVQWDRNSLRLAFVLTDLKGQEIAVVHHGTPPDLFKENSGVVVEGKISPEGRGFQAAKLMVKHSEEYRKPAHQAMDRALIEKSMFKGEKKS